MASRALGTFSRETAHLRNEEVRLQHELDMTRIRSERRERATGQKNDEGEQEGELEEVEGRRKPRRIPMPKFDHFKKLSLPPLQHKASVVRDGCKTFRTTGPSSVTSTIQSSTMTVLKTFHTF